MPNLLLAARYAKSLVDLSVEKGRLEEAYADMQYLQALCKSSRDFVNLLRSPVIKPQKKGKVLQAVTAGKISELTVAFNNLLILKGREGDLPEIANAFIDQYNTIKGIHKIKLTTAAPIAEAVRDNIINKVKANTGLEQVEIETATNEALIGGFVLEFNNNLVDASVARELKGLKKQFTGNMFEHKIR